MPQLQPMPEPIKPRPRVVQHESRPAESAATQDEELTWESLPPDRPLAASEPPVGQPPIAAPPPDPGPPTDEQRAPFTTLIGPAPDLVAFADTAWESMAEALAATGASRPELLALPDRGSAARDRDQDSAAELRVAVVRHNPGASPTVAAALAERLNGSEITVETGFFLRPAALPAPSSPGPWRVSTDPSPVTQLNTGLGMDLVRCNCLLGGRDLLARTATAPRRLVLIDSGDEGAAEQVTFDAFPPIVDQPPRDELGHGTAVGGLIRAVAPQAEITCFRVVADGRDTIESAILLNAVVEAIAYGDVDVLCIPVRDEENPRLVRERTGLQRILERRVARGMPMPVIVCAAGNDGPDEPMAFPALVPGVLVVSALDASGSPADYNCLRPDGWSEYIHQVEAYGGESGRPFVTLTRSDGARAELYGTSFGAGLVAGAVATF